MEKNTWGSYHEKTAERSPRPSVLEAIELTTSRDRALDLGAGAMSDTQLMLDRGFAEVEKIGKAFTHYHNTLRNVNRVALATCLLVILKNADVRPVELEEYETFSLVWVSAEELLADMNAIGFILCKRELRGSGRRGLRCRAFA
jgi:hypothetical protein